ncbi:MAG: hypothetical protein JWO31_595 [Phycisphaerales bacterium]|nr:hypothetical protein [Phycisphaerales bacterium]
MLGDGAGTLVWVWDVPARPRVPRPAGVGFGTAMPHYSPGRPLHACSRGELLFGAAWFGLFACVWPAGLVLWLAVGIAPAPGWATVIAVAVAVVGTGFTTVCALAAGSEVRELKRRRSGTEKSGSGG